MRRSGRATTICTAVSISTYLAMQPQSWWPSPVVARKSSTPAMGLRSPANPKKGDGGSCSSSLRPAVDKTTIMRPQSNEFDTPTRQSTAPIRTVKNRPHQGLNQALDQRRAVSGAVRPHTASSEYPAPATVSLSRSCNSMPPARSCACVPYGGSDDPVRTCGNRCRPRTGANHFCGKGHGNSRSPAAAPHPFTGRIGRPGRHKPMPTTRASTGQLPLRV